MPCAPTPGVVPTIAVDTLEHFTSFKALSAKSGQWPFLAGLPYHYVIGGSGYYNPDVVQAASDTLEQATAVGVFVPGQVDLGQIDKQTIVRPATFQGRFVLVEIATANVLGSLPITGTSNSWMLSDGPYELALRHSLESVVQEAAAKQCNVKTEPDGRYDPSAANVTHADFDSAIARAVTRTSKSIYFLRRNERS